MDLEALAPADAALWAAMGQATPRFTPTPTPGAANELRAVETITATLGQKLLPWQRWTVRVLTEKRRDDPRRYRFPEVVVTVPRQSGKTTVVRGILLARAVMNPSYRAFYSAQTGKDAAERWADLCEAVTRSPIAPAFTYRRAIGSQRLIVDKHDSRIAPFAPTPESLHGYTPNVVALDEVFAFDAMQGNDLLGAIKPAQQTLPDRQLILLSTAGHAGSTFLRERVDLGRAAVDNPASGMGYVEWSMPEGCDPYDEQVWRHHPALGHLITLDDLRELAATTPKGEWQRAFCNLWVQAHDPLFDMVAWGTLGADLAAPRLSDCVVGFSQASDRSRAAVVAAWVLPDGRRALKLVVSTQDVSSFAARLVEIDEQGPITLVGDDGGLDRPLIDEVRRALPSHRDVTALSPKDWVLGSTRFAASITDGTVVHASDDHLTAAVSSAVSKPMGEAWAVSHRSRPEVVAAVAALRGLDARPAPVSAPFIYVPGESA